MPLPRFSADPSYAPDVIKKTIAEAHSSHQLNLHCILNRAKTNISTTKKSITKQMLKSPSEESNNEARQQQNETKIKKLQVKVVLSG